MLPKPFDLVDFEFILKAFAEERQLEIGSSAGRKVGSDSLEDAWAAASSASPAAPVASLASPLRAPELPLGVGDSEPSIRKHDKPGNGIMKDKGKGKDENKKEKSARETHQRKLSILVVDDSKATRLAGWLVFAHPLSRSLAAHNPLPPTF